MACGGLKSTEREFAGKYEKVNPTRRIVNMAVDMMAFVEECVLDDGSQLTIKIGVHYGRAIAGIIGYHKPQFSLIGDTVNTTSRCCSTGLDGKVTLSDTAYEQVARDGFKFEERVIYAKGKGDMKTYILKRSLQKDKITRALPMNQNGLVRSMMTINDSEIKGSIIGEKLSSLPDPENQTPKLNKSKKFGD
jgi:hypothetical protein